MPINTPGVINHLVCFSTVFTIYYYRYNRYIKGSIVDQYDSTSGNDTSQLVK